MVQGCDHTNPEGDEHDAIDEAPSSPKVRVRSPKESIGDHFDDSLDREQYGETYVSPDEPVQTTGFTILEILLLVERRCDTGEENHRNNGRIDECREREPKGLVRVDTLETLMSSARSDDPLACFADGIVRRKDEQRLVVVRMSPEIFPLSAFSLL